MMLAYKSFIVLPFTCGLKLVRYVVGSRSTTFSFVFFVYIYNFPQNSGFLPFPYCCLLPALS